MMEPSNLLLHQHEQHSGSSSFPVAQASSHLAGSNCSHHEWNPAGLILNTGEYNPSSNEVLSSSRNLSSTEQSCEVILVPPLTTSMVQDLGLHWPYTVDHNYANNNTTNQAASDLSKIKEEPSDSLAKLTITKTTKDPSTLGDQYHFPPASYLKQLHGFHLSAGDYPFDNNYTASFGGRGNYSVVLPTANVCSSTDPSYFSAFPGQSFQNLDLLASSRFGRPAFDEVSSAVSNPALFREHRVFGMGCLQEPTQEPSNSHHEMSSLVTGAPEVKRGNAAMDSSKSAFQQAPIKKPRFESRSSFSPFKVRKEKLGDRIAALQQLVAPFGKTDTASVLMEAIGYIKFLQDQVQTLSVPYMRSSNSNKHRVSSGEREESKLDLRSRGLCLVPLSCTSYVTNESVGIWPPPNFRGGI